MVESFRSITDVRSNLRHEMNLLHFIIETLEQKCAEILKFNKEIGAVFEAAKFSRSEMEVELKAIQETLKEIENELRAQKTRASGTESMVVDPLPTGGTPKSDSKMPKCKGDKFVEVVEGFLTAAKKQMAEVERLNAEMLKKVGSRFPG